MRIPISGGNYIRQLPHTLLSRVVAHRIKHDDQPLVFYVMPWELDADQPRLRGVPPLQQVRHYRRLGKTRWVLKDYFHKYRFCSIAEHLGVSVEAQRSVRPPVPQPTFVPHVSSANSVPITVVVPVFNEAVNIGYLRRSLLELRSRLAGRYETHFLLIDDGSTDDTYQCCRREFADVSDARVVQNERNLGVAAAIRRGIELAETEIVCSIDSDGSYDPLVLEHMVPLAAAADLVTASPYHPRGEVIHVPAWRLFLSKSLCRMYSFALGSRFHTFTSCCRVYRRSSIMELELRHDGFLGVAEMLIELKRNGGRIVEYPTRLESRILGRSKMKVARTIIQHLNLLRELAFAPSRKRTGAAVSEPPTSRKPGADSRLAETGSEPVLARLSGSRDD